jgi:hypothetical protein
MATTVEAAAASGSDSDEPYFDASFFIDEA